MKTQINVRLVTVEIVMRSREFAIGLAEVRKGRPPNSDRFTEIDPAWNDERGRQFEIVAPPNMPLKIGRRLNPDAVELFERSEIR
jgi:hypothetical protein